MTLPRINEWAFLNYPILHDLLKLFTKAKAVFSMTGIPSTKTVRRMPPSKSQGKAQTPLTCDNHAQERTFAD